MPFFRPLTEAELSAKSLEVEVRECLRKSRENKASTDSDLRWRHVRYYDYDNEGKDEKKLVMFDLVAMDDCDDDQNVESNYENSVENSVEEKQFKALWKRLSEGESIASLNIT